MLRVEGLLVDPVDDDGGWEDTIVSIGPDVLIEEDSVVVDPVELLGELEVTVDEATSMEVARVEGILVDPVEFYQCNYWSFLVL